MPKNLTLAELRQLCSYANHFDESGEYYGNKEQFLKRHQKILEILEEEISKQLAKTSKSAVKML